MAITSKFLRDIEAEARPIIERQINDAKIIAGLRDVVSAAGGDWGALKALIKARVEDENDESGEGKRVRKIREKADCTVAYDDMLGSNMNGNKNIPAQSYAEAKGVERTTPEASNAKAPRVFISAFSTTQIDQEQPSQFGTREHMHQQFDAAHRKTTDTQEQPETASQSETADQVDEVPTVTSAKPVEPSANEYAGTSSDENPAPDATKAETMAGFASVQIPHSPAPQASQALQADKTSEAVTPPAASLAPPMGTKLANVDCGSDPLPALQPTVAGQAGAVTSLDAPATVSKPVNPDCRRAAKGEQCALSHSQASCSACQQAADQRRARAA